jgi:pimeloyl-ACP methyl ester carboxylesterase
VNSHELATLDGHTLVYSTAGRPGAPPLLLVHGWFSFRGVWWQTMAALQDSHFCVALDLLGFGHSDKPEDADYSIEAQGRRILQLADILGLDRFDLAGHSMGGQIALCVASMLAPERVNRLVSVAGVVSARLTPLVENTVYRQTEIGMANPWLFDLARWLVRYRWYAYRSFRSWFHEMDAVPFDQWAVDRRMAFQPGIIVSAYKAGRAIHDLDLTAHLPRISAPTLAIFGRQDAVVLLSDGHLVDQHVPDSRLVLIDHCGHFPMYERPRQYLEALRGFLLA